jgi:membrane protein
MIVFFGAEISFAHQNIGTFEFDRESREVSFGMKKLLALRISHLVIQRFGEAKSSLTMTQMSGRLEIPIRLVHRIVGELVECRVFAEVESSEPEEPAFQPAVDTSLLSMGYIVSALERLGSDNIPILQTGETAALATSLKRFQEIIDQSPDNLLLKDLK